MNNSSVASIALSSLSTTKDGVALNLCVNIQGKVTITQNESAADATTTQWKAVLSTVSWFCADKVLPLVQGGQFMENIIKELDVDYRID